MQFAIPFDPDDPRWTAYVLGELDADLDAADLAEIEQQLEHSAAARQYVDELRQTIGMLSAELESEPVLQLTAEQRSAIDREAHHNPRTALVTPASAVLAKRQADLASRTRASRWVGVLVALAASLLVVATLVVPGLQNASQPTKVAQSDAGAGSNRWDADDHLHFKRTQNELFKGNLLGRESGAAGQVDSEQQLGDTEVLSKEHLYSQSEVRTKGLAKQEVDYTVAKPTYETKTRYANSAPPSGTVDAGGAGLLNGYVASGGVRFGDETAPTTGPSAPLGEDAYRGVAVKSAGGAVSPNFTAGQPSDWDMQQNAGGAAGGGQRASKPRGGLVVTGSRGLAAGQGPAPGLSAGRRAPATGAPPVYFRTTDGATAAGAPADAGVVLQAGQAAGFPGGPVTLYEGESREKLKQLADGTRPYLRYNEYQANQQFYGLDIDGLAAGEAYDEVTDNPFLPAGDNPLSTFSIDVDTASYSNMRRFITQNHRLPPKSAVRIEEMLNYFSYDYPQPDGDVPFSVNAEVAECPWNVGHRLVRIGLKGREVAAQKRPPSNLVFLCDVSGSMNEPNKLPLVKQSLRMLAEQLGENDRVAIVVYAGNSGLVLPSTTGNNRETIITALDRLEAGGSTNGGQGIQLAYEIALSKFIAGGVNRVILATDGDFNVGITDRAKLVELIEQQAKSGVFLTTLGYGFGNLKDATLEQLADHGNGNYAYIDDVREAKKVFVEQMSGTLITIAKDVKIQIEFNPSQVGSYRLIGYENRILAHQDFNNDAKDAGDIGAGHTVTALYEIALPAAADARPVVDPLKYQQQNKLSEKAGSGELLTLKLRYKQPEAKESKLLEYPVKDSGHRYGQATRDFKFAAAVAAFGMLLRDSPHKGTATMAGALELAQEGQGSDEKGYRQEFVSLIQQAKAIYDAAHPATPAVGGKVDASKVDEPITHAGPVTLSGEAVTSATPLVAGEAVLVEWGGSWWKATVVDVRPQDKPDGNVKIHYSGWESQWDEIVPLDRLRK